MPNKNWWIRKRLRDRFHLQQSFLSYPAARGYRIHPIPVEDRSGVKTRKMLELENEFNKPIEHLLLAGESQVVAVGLGITEKRVIMWIRILNLRWTQDRLPSCSGCKWVVRTCNPSSETHGYPLSCRILSLTKQRGLHNMKVRELRAKAI